MRRDYIDFHLVRDEHLQIHGELENWARWVRVRPDGWQIAPMFRMYRSNWRQWHVPETRPSTNIPEAIQMENRVSCLPDKQRTAIRWVYVFGGQPMRMARTLGVNQQGLADLVNSGRAMLQKCAIC